MNKVKKAYSPTIKKQRTVAVLIIVLVLAGVIMLLVWNGQESPATEPVITDSINTPDESKPNADNYNWRGAPDEPKKIRISKIGVDAFVQKSGVDQENKIAVPNNVHLASWFTDSQKPGHNGLSIISGHVSGRTVDGIFKQLKEIAEGDEFEIELGSGEVKRYKVLRTDKVAEAESANILFSQNPKVKSQVNLITCGGNFDESTDQYEDRVIVSGQLIN